MLIFVNMRFIFYYNRYRRKSISSHIGGDTQPSSSHKKNGIHILTFSQKRKHVGLECLDGRLERWITMLANKL